jgi:hypothetical protein
MSHRNARLIAAWMLGAALFVTHETFAEEGASATNRPAFGASLRGGETVGDHQVQRVFLDVGTNQFAFIVPTGFRMDASDPQKIVLSDNAGTCFLTVRISSLRIPPAPSPDKFFQTEALSRFPGARITAEASDFAAGHSGDALDLEWTGTGGTKESARVAFIPCAAGVLEFSALARTVNFKDAQMYLTVLMTSVRSNETGKLVITPLPDFS